MDTALDLLVFAPVGLALSAAEEIPKLAAKGRSRVTSQLNMARVVGQFAVTRARSEVESRLRPPERPAPPPAPAAASSPAEVASTNGSSGTHQEPAAAASSAPATEAPATPVSTRRPPAAASLAIPGYDSLSASQVVQRLAGLSAEELEAVEAYEAAHRARRTILNRIQQLRSA